MTTITIMITAITTKSFTVPTDRNDALNEQRRRKSAAPFAFAPAMHESRRRKKTRQGRVST